MRYTEATILARENSQTFLVFVFACLYMACWMSCHSRECLHAPLCHTGPTTEVCFGFYNHCNVMLARSSHLTVINPNASPPSGRNPPTRSSIAELMEPFQIRVLGMCMYCNICVTESENREKQLVLVYCGTMWNALYTYSPTHTHTHPHTHTHTCTHTHTHNARSSRILSDPKHSSF